MAAPTILISTFAYYTPPARPLDEPAKLNATPTAFLESGFPLTAGLSREPPEETGPTSTDTCEQVLQVDADELLKWTTRGVDVPADPEGQKAHSQLWQMAQDTESAYDPNTLLVRQWERVLPGDAVPDIQEQGFERRPPFYPSALSTLLVQRGKWDDDHEVLTLPEEDVSDADRAILRTARGKGLEPRAPLKLGISETIPEGCKNECWKCEFDCPSQCMDSVATDGTPCCSQVYYVAPARPPFALLFIELLPEDSRSDGRSNEPGGQLTTPQVGALERERSQTRAMLELLEHGLYTTGRFFWFCAQKVGQFLKYCAMAINYYVIRPIIRKARDKLGGGNNAGRMRPVAIVHGPPPSSPTKTGKPAGHGRSPSSKGTTTTIVKPEPRLNPLRLPMLRCAEFAARIRQNPRLAERSLRTQVIGEELDKVAGYLKLTMPEANVERISRYQNSDLRRSWWTVDPIRGQRHKRPPPMGPKHQGLHSARRVPSVWERYYMERAIVSEKMRRNKGNENYLWHLPHPDATGRKNIAKGDLGGFESDQLHFASDARLAAASLQKRAPRARTKPPLILARVVCGKVEHREFRGKLPTTVSVNSYEFHSVTESASPGEKIMLFNTWAAYPEYVIEYNVERKVSANDLARFDYKRQTITRHKHNRLRGSSNWEKSTMSTSPVEVVLEKTVPLRTYQTPTYWDGSAADKSSDGFALLPLDKGKDKKVWDSLTRLLKETNAAYLGNGRDHAGYPDYDNLRLAAAWRFENPALWDTHVAAKEKISGELTRLGTFTNMGAPAKTKAYYLHLPGGTQPDVNEAFLVHGAPPGVLLNILSTGLNERYSGSNAGTAYGDGIYLAEDAGKADQYTQVDTGLRRGELKELHKRLYGDGVRHPGKVFYLLVCRVTLGYQVRTNTFCRTSAGSSGTGPRNCLSMDTDKPIFPVTSRELADVPDVTPPMRYHSLLADVMPSQRFREFVVFHSEYVYPEYVIAYQRFDGSRGPV